MTRTNPLQYRPNACPLCLICLVCTEVYGKNCICPPKELKWQRKSNEYKIDFRRKLLGTVEARKERTKLDNVFVNWFHNNILPDLEIPEDQYDVNVCRRCINKFEYYKKSMCFYIYCNINFFISIMSCYLFALLFEALNHSKKIKSRSDLAGEGIIDLDNDNDTIDEIINGVNTIDLTKKSPLKTLPSKDLNVFETNTLDTSIQDKRQKQKQIIPSKLLINQKLLSIRLEMTQHINFYNLSLYSFSML